MSDAPVLERLEALIQIALPPIEAVEKETDLIRVLRLCDYTHTREDMAKKLAKSLNRIDVTLNALRKSGKIKSLSRNGETVYVRVRSGG